LASLIASPHGDQTHRLTLEAGWIALALTPWIAFASLRAIKLPASEFDRIWIDFRNRFGFVWAQRLREQFNRSAANAGWRVVLRWQGIRLLPGSPPPDPSAQTAMLAVLQALLKRFGTDTKTPVPEEEGKPTGLLR
jgi:hypothetical protein